MNIPQTDLIYYGVVLVGGVAGAIYAWRKGTARAESETTKIYEDLNRALKEQVGALEEKVDDTQQKLATLETNLRQVTLNMNLYEELISRSLNEYWVAHPAEARRQRKGAA